MRILIAAVISSMLGILFAHLASVGGFITLGVWAIAGLTIGFISRNKKEALFLGSLFGFTISFVFLIADYQGSIAVVYRFFPFALLSCVGLVGGLLLGILGFLFRKLLKK